MSFNYVEQTMERVLVIDDDVGLCELVGEYLQPEGYTVEAIHNGERGIDRALRLLEFLVGRIAAAGQRGKSEEHHRDHQRRAQRHHAKYTRSVYAVAR